MEHVNEFLKYSLEVLAIFGIVIEVTPIKFSPIKWIANKFNEDIKKELKEVKKDIEQLQIKADERDIARWNEYHVKYASLNGELKIAIKNIEDSYQIAKFEEE